MQDSFRKDLLDSVTIFERGTQPYLGGYQRYCFLHEVELLEFSFQGNLKNSEETPSKAITSFMQKHLFDLVSSIHGTCTRDPRKEEEWETSSYVGTFVGQHGFCEFSRSTRGGGTGGADSFSVCMKVSREFDDKSEFISQVLDLFCELQLNALPVARIYTLAQTENGLDFKELQNVAKMFLPSNYPPEVVQGFERLAQNIERCPPAGRLAILSGLPGTGKTFFFRGLLHRVAEAQFVLVDPGILSQISQPQLIRTFLDFTSQKRATVLIVEDADSCLVQRMADNVNHISSLLNLTDGIYGDAFNLHVLASTNQANIHIDEALKRPGRLHQTLDFRPLTQAEASRIFQREMGYPPLKPFDTIQKHSLGLRNNAEEAPSVTIAEVYHQIGKLRQEEPPVTAEHNLKKSRTVDFMRF
jgi:hypothetical protein